MQVVDIMKEISFFSIWLIYIYCFMSCQRSREVFFDENNNVNICAKYGEARGIP